MTSYCAETAEEILQRLCEGESLTKIGADPAMPCLSTPMRWRRCHSEFAELVALGKTVMAERFCDQAGSWSWRRRRRPPT